MKLPKLRARPPSNGPKKIEGVFTTVKGAVSTADQGVLLANRALFLSQRYPFLVRLQTRLGVQETIEDSFAVWDDESFDSGASKAAKITGSIGQMAREIGEGSLKLKAAIKAYREAFPKNKSSNSMKKMNKAFELTKEIQKLPLSWAVEGSRRKRPSRRPPIAFLPSYGIWRLQGFSFLLPLLIFWWGGYLFVKRSQSRALAQ